MLSRSYGWPNPALDLMLIAWIATLNATIQHHHFLALVHPLPRKEYVVGRIQRTEAASEPANQGR